QQRFGYPALTQTIKDKVFGLNAAKLFGVDPTATRCALTSDPLTSNQPEFAALQADGVLASPWTPNGPTDRRQMLQRLASPATRWLPA
ncbi:MAG TPA: hypothetical protein VNY84_09400, partial [Acidimicrobiales bacterium]|nr:hypothetical protein [Acidimicrobiales bacterium]